MARRLRDGWLTWRKRQWTREANSERRPWTRPFSSYLRPVLHHPSSHCVDDDSEFLCVSLEKAFARWTGEVVVDVVLDDSGRREGTCDRSFGSRFRPTTSTRTPTALLVWTRTQQKLFLSKSRSISWRGDSST